MTLKGPQTAVIATLAAVALLIVGLGTVLVVLPQRSQAGQLQQQIATAQAALLNAQAPSSATSGAASQERATDLFRLMEAMPDNNEMPGILLDLSGLARISEVSITSVKPSPIVPLAGSYSALPIAIVVNGTYDGVTKFLRLMREDVQQPNGRLDVSGRLLITNGIDLTSPDGRSVSATLNLDAFDYGAIPSATVTSASSGAGTTTTSTSTTTTTTSTASGG